MGCSWRALRDEDKPARGRPGRVAT